MGEFTVTVTFRASDHYALHLFHEIDGLVRDMDNVVRLASEIDPNPDVCWDEP